MFQLDVFLASLSLCITITNYSFDQHVGFLVHLFHEFFAFFGRIFRCVLLTFFMTFEIAKQKDPIFTTNRYGCLTGIAHYTAFAVWVDTVRLLLHGQVFNSISTMYDVLSEKWLEERTDFYTDTYTCIYVDLSTILHQTR